MKNYTKGLITKANIVETCKTLFYDNGYSDTTFAEICEKAQANPGTVVHHFKNKKNIASTIYNEAMRALDNETAELFPEENELVQAITALGLHQKLLFEDVRYRRFSSQFSSECIHSEPLDHYERYVAKAYALTVRYAGPKKADFLFTAFKGMDCYIEPYIDEHMGELTFEEIFRYTVELYYSFVNRAELEEGLARAVACINETDVGAANFIVSMRRRQTQV